MTRRRALAALAFVVAIAHLWLADGVLPDSAGAGAGEAMPVRIDVAFVTELAPSEPPPPPEPRTRRLRVPAAPPAAAASAAIAGMPKADTAVAAAMPEVAPLPDLPAPIAAASMAAAASAASPAEAVATAAAGATPVDAASPGSTPVGAESPGAAPVGAGTPGSAPVGAGTPNSAPVGAEWPPSTRLSYTVSGNYRGPVDGQARVEWLRSGSRYQVQMDLSIGPSFAPLMSRRVASEGEITAAGLRPVRYDEETRVVMRDTRRQAIRLDADRIRLPDGSEVPRPPGVQDSASQFVQLTWMFTMRPELLRPGVSIDLPLALPRRVENWTYDVVGAVTLTTPAGAVPALHVKPRREARPGTLTAEMWIAPSLQYLPVRLLIRQDAENFVDLLIERLPQQAVVVPPPPR